MADLGRLLEEAQRNAEDMERARVGFAKMADLAKSYYDALVRAGFNEGAALYLTGVMQGVWITAAVKMGGGQDEASNAGGRPA